MSRHDFYFAFPSRPPPIAVAAPDWAPVPWWGRESPEDWDAEAKAEVASGGDRTGSAAGRTELGELCGGRMEEVGGLMRVYQSR